MMMMQNMCVMYHYVRERDEWKGIVPLSPSQFELHIDVINRTHEIVSLDELKNKRKNLSKPFCILSFDDGTKDQYTEAFSILERKGVPAHFAIMSGPVIDNEIPLVHLVHTILSFKSSEEIWQLLSSQFDTEDIDKESQIYSYETDKLRRYIKYMLNFRLSIKESEKFLKGIFKTIFPDKTKFINDFYIAPVELIKMHRAGMTIGVHAHRHLPYNGDATAFYVEEIEPCKEYLENLLGLKMKWYTPPFGGGGQFKNMVNELTPVLVENGFSGGLSTVPGFIDNESSFWYKRWDCNKIISEMSILNMNDLI